MAKVRASTWKTRHEEAKARAAAGENFADVFAQQELNYWNVIENNGYLPNSAIGTLLRVVIEQRLELAAHRKVIDELVDNVDSISGHAVFAAEQMIAVCRLCVEKGILTAEEVAGKLAALEALKGDPKDD